MEVLDTRAPGVSGYSFLILISAEFTPIQLGFGFTLNGVGGLCGIRRAVSVQALQAVVRDGSLAPLHLRARPGGPGLPARHGAAARLPPTGDRCVFGPMFKIGWGTPTLVTADLGPVLQLPAPIIFALLGTLNATLPKPEAAIVELHLDIAGVLNTSEKRLSIDASLRDSRVGPFTLTGDMPLRFLWGGAGPTSPSRWAASTPAPGGPPASPPCAASRSPSAAAPTTMSASPRTSPSPPTPSSSGRAELYAEAAGFNICGYLEFRALFIFSPFSFRFDFAAGVALRRGTSVLAGISVAGQIEGPRPWHVKGSASLTILFFDVSVDFDTTFGDPPSREQIETIDIWSKLLPALLDVRNWSAGLPTGRARWVSTSADRGVPARVRLDPLSELAVRQKVLPLERWLTKLGEGHIEGPCCYRVRAVRLGADATGGGGRAVSTSPVLEAFAAGQYETLTDAERLSRPSFEPTASGSSSRPRRPTRRPSAWWSARASGCRARPQR